MSNEWEVIDNYSTKNKNEILTELNKLNQKLRLIEEQNERNHSLLLNIENKLRNREVIELNQHLRKYCVRKIDPIGFVPEPKQPLSSLFSQK